MNLRRKILTGFVSAFVLFVLAMYPLASQIVQRLIAKAISDRASELIQKMEGAADDEALVQKLKDQKYLIFFRVALITDDRRLLYDSYLKRLLGPGFNDKPALNHPEVEQAFRDGIGFHEGFSKQLNQRFVYMAKAFDFNGKTYVLRTAFPYQFVADLTYDVKIGLLGLSIFALSLFAIMMWAITNRFTRPILELITLIKPFQEGRIKTLPEIRLQGVQPEDEMGQLATTLNSLSSKVQAYINAMRDFIANASHELKTPITVIRGYAETLHDHPNLPPETYHKITQRIVHSCERMGALIQDLLSLTDMEKIADARLTECDLYVLAENCTHLFQEIFPDAHVAFHSDVGPSAVIKADPSLLELAIMNLLENAGKYSKEPAQVTLHLSQANSNLCLSVSDRGIGIPRADIDRIFDRFYTVDKAHSRKLGGSGLGLSIVATIIQKHRGSISVASEVGQGSTFTITLPA